MPNQDGLHFTPKQQARHKGTRCRPYAGNRTCGSEGGEAGQPAIPTPIQIGNQTLGIEPKRNTTITVFDGASRTTQVQQLLRIAGQGENPPEPSTTLLPFGGGCDSVLTGIIVSAGGCFANWQVTCECKYAPVKTCTKQQELALKAVVNAACKGPLSGKACGPWMSKADALVNAGKFQACAAARNAINTICVGGGDPGHQQAANDAARAAAKCLDVAGQTPVGGIQA